MTPARSVGTGTHAPATPRTQPPTGITRPWFGLIRFRSPLLTEYPFLQVLRCFTSLRTPGTTRFRAHDGRRVAPFGNPRIEAMLEAPRGLSHPQTSFIGTVCQGIHHTPFRAAHAPKNPNDSFKRQTTNHHTVKNDHKTIDLETRLQKEAWRNRDKASRTTILHCSRPLSSSQTTTRPDRTRPTGPQAHGVPPGASGKPHATTSRGWRSGNPKAYPYHSPDPQKESKSP